MEPESRAGAEFLHPLTSHARLLRTRARKIRKWPWGFVLMLAGLPIYYVRELLASLLLFSLLFLLGSLFVFIVFLAWHGVQATGTWVRTALILTRRLVTSYKFPTG